MHKNLGKTITSKENYYRARFIIDIFMFSTLVNGITCEITQNRSQALKIVNYRQCDSTEQFYQVLPLNNNQVIHNGNALATVVFDKMLNWIFDNKIEEGDQNRKGRTFGLGQRFVGHRKRLQFALLPIMYKMGVMTTLLTGLTVLALKGLTIGVILLFFVFGKHIKVPEHSSQPIHLHVHSLDKPGKFVKYHEYGGENYNDPWVRADWEREEPVDQVSKPTIQDSWESYRRRFLQYTAEMLKYNPFDNTKTT